MQYRNCPKAITINNILSPCYSPILLCVVVLGNPTQRWAYASDPAWHASLITALLSLPLEMAGTGLKKKYGSKFHSTCKTLPDIRRNTQLQWFHLHIHRPSQAMQDLPLCWHFLPVSFARLASSLQAVVLHHFILVAHFYHLLLTYDHCFVPFSLF